MKTIKIVAESFDITFSLGVGVNKEEIYRKMMSAKEDGLLLHLADGASVFVGKEIINKATITFS